MSTVSKNTNIETIVLTGASGFIGSNLLSVLREKYHIYAFARRTQKEIGIPLLDNITWILVDITDKKKLSKIFYKIRDEKNRLCYSSCRLLRFWRSSL